MQNVMLALLNKGVINSVTSLNYAAFISSIWLGVAAVYRLFDKRFGPVF